MFDEKMRQVKDYSFNPLAKLFLAIPPWQFSMIGLLVGIAAAAALWQQMYPLGFILWFLNRAFDGLDGAVARLSDAQSDFGGYLDIIIDFVVYALIPIGLALGQMATAVAVNPTAIILSLIFLLFTFYVNAASWMYLAAILEKRNHHHEGRLTTVTMPAGIIGGTETIIFFTAFIFFPAALVWLFSLMGLLIIMTILQRLVWAARHLGNVRN